MRLGVDFDNTIVRYDEVFHGLALERGWVPAGVGPRKDDVRDHLRKAGREDDWTELQGIVYGPGMERAQPFPGALECLARCASAGVELWIISHRSLRPYRGEAHDLHAAARGWVSRHLQGVLPSERVVFEPTKEGKLKRIGESRCDRFIDDLPELLLEPAFPSGVERWLFDPGRRHEPHEKLKAFQSWKEIETCLFPKG